MTATHLLVGNSTAQSGRNAERIERAVKRFAAGGVACDVLPTLPGGRTIGAVAGALRDGAYACVVAMGGDGTFREVAAGLIESGRAEAIAMGMLPTGTANDQGRSFGLQAGDDALDRNVDVVRAARETRLDAGRISTGGEGVRGEGVHAEGIHGEGDGAAWFFDSAGWGISARVLRARNEDRVAVDKSAPLLKAVYRDQMVYAGALLRVFLESYVVDDRFAVDVVADGTAQRLEGLTDLVVKGTRVYGGAWVFDRSARHDDGAFEVVPFRGKLDWTSKAIVDLDGNPLTEEVLNAVGVGHSRPFRASRIDLAFTWPAAGAAPAAQIDGEEFPATARVAIEVVPRAIRLIVPA
jgi:diacylglycerol kinase family enzyme